jgi:hypothetical protein
MGFLLLYAALALVALWLIAELLLQNRAALLWRALALGGFLCVVAGMRLKSVPVIGAGAVGFALGQVFVTLSVKRGRAVGWSLRRADGSLPGLLAKVPLLSAATGGAAVVAEAEETPTVGEVGPIEAEEHSDTSYEYEEVQELASDGVYAEEPASPYYQQPQVEQQQPYYQPQYQQAGYDQQWQQQPAYQYGQSYGQPQYQDPYAQPQYQDPYAAAQHAQQPWEYQQQTGEIPQQQSYDYQTQQWNYQHYQQQG